MLELLLGIALVFGSHELGHQVESDRLSVNRSQNSIFPPSGTVDTYDPDKLARIAAAGFRGQDIAAASVNTGAIHVASAGFKLAYAMRNSGDMWTMKLNKGDTMLREALVITALCDLYAARNEGHTWRLTVWQSDSGTPGVMFHAAL
jgi:hypothetical protein